MNIVGNRTLRSLLEHWARSLPDKTFLVFEDAQQQEQTFTYGEFDRLVNRAANVLQTLGVKKGDKFNLHLPNCPEFLALWLGGAKIGAVMVPTNPVSTADEMEYILTHSESVISVAQPDSLGVLKEVRPRCPNVKHLVACRTEQMSEGALSLSRLLAGASAELGPSELASLDEAGMIYTSGTTARPKGVLLTHANYVYVGEVVSKHLRISPEDRHLVALPLFHGNAQYYSTMSTLVTGATMVLLERFSASRYFDQVRRHEATVASLFAAPMRMLLAQPEKPQDRDNRLRLVIFAQNLTDAQLAEWDRRFGAPLSQIYGMTEVPFPMSNPLDYPRKNDTIGMCALGYDAMAVDEEGWEAPAGVVGQLVVRGEPGVGLMKGYFKNPQATSDTIRDGWLQTGDNVYVDEDGYFHFVDRAKDMIKRSGENVAAGEVERVVCMYPKVFDCSVIGVPDPIRDEAVAALVILKEGETASPEEIIEWCRVRLAKFKVPEFVEFRDSFPRTSVGKVQKHILRKEGLRGAGS
ncbi:MAG: AMP-binding protein [Dehalococcoidia bacterium]|nr:AMP-binding protein [Dehalococcoidia bacterium]